MRGKAKKKLVFLKNRPQKRSRNFPKKQCFSRCFCFSDHSKKFPTYPMTMFKVSRRCPWIISLRSYGNRNRTTHQSKDMHGKAKKLVFLKNRPQKSGLKALKKLYFWRCFCFSDHSKKFSTHPMTMFKVSRRCPWIISLRSYKKQNCATHQSKDMHGKAKKLDFLKNRPQKRGRNF